MSEAQVMRLALRLARGGYGATSPNPVVGAVLVEGGKILGKGWHRRAGLPHAEIEAIRDAQSKKENLKGATLFVTLEPCCTHGRTPVCTEVIVAAALPNCRGSFLIPAIFAVPAHLEFLNSNSTELTLLTTFSSTSSN